MIMSRSINTQLSDPSMKIVTGLTAGWRERAP